MDSYDGFAPPNPLTVEELRQELRSATDVLSHEFRAFGYRMEELLSSNLGKCNPRSPTESSPRGRVSLRDSGASLPRGRASVMNSGARASVRLASQGSSGARASVRHGSQGRASVRNVNPRSTGVRANVIAIAARKQPIDATCATDSVELSRYRRSFQSAKEDGDSDASDTVVEACTDAPQQLHVRSFPKRGATSVTGITADTKKEHRPLLFKAEDTSSDDDSNVSSWADRHLSEMSHKSTGGATNRSVRFQHSINLWYKDDEGDVFVPEAPSIWKICVESDLFKSLIVWLLTFNIIFIGIETDYLARNWATDGPSWFISIEVTFCTCFVSEITVRMLACGHSFFSDQGSIFDSCVVLAQIGELAVTLYTSQSSDMASHSCLLRAVRFIRILRCVRLFRIVRQVNELNLLLGSVIDTFRPLFWMLLLLTSTTAMFAILLTQIATEHKISNREHEHEELEKYYGSVDQAMLCLYQVISEGIHWHELLDPLTPFASPWITPCFVAYVAVTVLAMMNIIMGIFVDSVAKNSENRKKRTLVSSMQQLFLEADQDGSGTLDVEEFEAQMSNPRMLQYLREIDLDPQDARELFQLIDVNGFGSIDPDEWLNGCLTLSGPAKSLDMATIVHEHRVFAKQWHAHAEIVEEVLSLLEEQLEKSGEREKMKSLVKNSTVLHGNRDGIEFGADSMSSADFEVQHWESLQSMFQ